MTEQEVFNFCYPDLDAVQKDISLKQGETLFVLGANGTGKSALMLKMFSQNHRQAKRISAHRQTWLNSSVLEYSPTSKLQTEASLVSYDTQATSRWKDDYQGARSQFTIYDLIYAQNNRARKIADAVDNLDTELVEKLRQKEAPLKTLNHLLKLSNLPIEIMVEKDEKLLASKNSGETYSIAELSDGERNAILIAADVLTAKPNTLLVIDEPERHLHRSIISPLLTSLFQERKDCSFVIASHDITLPLNNSKADILMVRGCKWESGSIIGWDTDLISSNDGVDYQIKQDILGSRRVLLFVEGSQNSLDLHLYQILFPSASIIPQGSCVDVEKAVHGISSTDSLHWVNALGLVDADDRSEAKIIELKSQSIYALPCYSVESIYYCAEMIEAIASRSAVIHGGEDTELVTAAHSALFEAVAQHKDRLCARLCERKIKHQMMPPNWETIKNESTYDISIDLSAAFNEEKQRFDEYVLSSDVASVVSRYPVRETPALSAIAKALKFSSRQNYEDAVRKLLTDDEDVRSQIKEKFGDLIYAFENQTDQPQQEVNAA